MQQMKRIEVEAAPELHNDSFLSLFLAEDAEPQEHITITTSGQCEPNPHGIGAWGFVVYCPHGDMIDVDMDDIGSGENVTNNVTEYVAVICALLWAATYAPDESVEVRTASKTVANQINGEFACKQPHLKELKDDAVELLKQTKAVVRWVSKKETLVADLLAKFAYLRAKHDYAEGEDD